MPDRNRLLLCVLCLFVLILDGRLPLAAQNRGGTPENQGVIPSPFGPLTKLHQDYLDRILKYWEFRSSQIKRYQCHFRRWEYDGVFGPKDPNTANTYSVGVIKYQAPDKGLFRVDEVLHYQPPAQQGQQPNYVKQEGSFGEHWVCNGKAVFEFQHRKKKLIERELPPHMQGKSIADGPLPFLFGAEAEKIKARYWLRIITPREAKGEYWLEAYPKFRADAANFKKVEVIIDEEKWLPKAIQVFKPEYDERQNPSRTVFQFDQRKYNWNVVVENLRFWEKEFFRPATPQGYELVVEKYQPVMVDNRLPPPQQYRRNAPAANQAQRNPRNQPQNQARRNQAPSRSNNRFQR